MDDGHLGAHAQHGSLQQPAAPGSTSAHKAAGQQCGGRRSKAHVALDGSF
jgi:hypothetical protein